MRRVCLPVVGMILLGLGSMHATEWAPLVKELAKSVVAIERDSNGTSCTGFVIHAKIRKEDKDLTYVLTAAHCEAPKLWADQAEAAVVAKNTEKDLLVLAVEHLDRPALKLAKDDPNVGDQVGAFGHGYGLEKPIFRLTHISAQTYIPYQGIGGPLYMTDSTFVGGMSGGPVINAAGEVVMMVQRGTDSVGIGVGADTMRSKIGRYWEKPKP